MLIVDGHQDLAYNILTFGRDYTLPAHEIRRREQGTETPSRNGDTLLGWPEYRQGQVAVVFSTLYASPARHRLGPWDHQSYKTAEQAHKIYRTQLDTYHRLEDANPDKFRLIHDRKDLEAVLSMWQKIETPDPHREEDPTGGDEQVPEERKPHPDPAPVGLVVLMEGAEGVRHLGELEEWWQLGLRLIGPSWAGTRFSGGTREPGPMTPEGFALLEGMADVGFGLDISHMDEEAALQALDVYPGTIIASHANAATLLKGVETNRHLSDRVIGGLLERDAVIGVVINNKFLKPGWTERDGRQAVSLHSVVAHIDYICQIAGDPYHAAIGTDFDGGFGWQTVPAEIDTIGDVQKLVPLLGEKGYSGEDIEAIFNKNWLNRLERILPEDR